MKSIPDTLVGLARPWQRAGGALWSAGGVSRSQVQTGAFSSLYLSAMASNTLISHHYTCGFLTALRGVTSKHALDQSSVISLADFAF